MKKFLNMLRASLFVWTLLSMNTYGALNDIGKTCDISQYFDLAQLACQTCFAAVGESTSQGRLPDKRSTQVANSATECTCGPGTKRSDTPKASDDSCFTTSPQFCNLVQCDTCPSNTAPSQDQSICMVCGAGVDPSTKDCLCSANSMLVEYDTNKVFLSTKTCVSCPTNSYSVAGSYECTPCSDSNMILVDGVCVCDTDAGYESTGIDALGDITCVESKMVVALSARYAVHTRIKLSDFATDEPVEVDSVVFQHYFTAAATGCFYYADERDGPACQVLANLCVLQHFDPNAPACALFTAIQTSGRTADVHGIKGWNPSLPFLIYEDRAPAILEKVDISMQMMFTSTNDLSNGLQYQLAKYALNGTFMGMELLSTQFMYCGTTTVNAGGPSLNTRWLQFGFGYSEAYNCDLSTIENQETFLYELYFVDTGGPHGGTLYPVPVRVLNFRGPADVRPNINTVSDDKDDDKLTHRFFLYDMTSWKTTADGDPTARTFAKRISLQMRSQESHANLIHPPVLTIEYEDIRTISTVTLDFKAEYVSSTRGFWSTSTGFFFALCALTCFVVVLRYFNWQRRNSRPGSSETVTSWGAPLRFVTLMFSFFACNCFWLLFLLSGYYFIAFKLQNTVSMLLPEDDDQLMSSNEYYIFQLLLLLCFSLQFLSVLAAIYRQTNLDVFFIDWEKPRSKLVDHDAITGEVAPISIWRTILVANEWNELQSIRQTSVEFTVILLTFLLVGCKLENLATPQPTTSDLSPGTLNLYLRFFNTAFWWLVLCYAQRLWKFLVYERFITEPKGAQFIDMCTMAKVSCIILDERYHGYYLHCRSPYPFADGSMAEITDQLKQEEAGLMSGRGLPGCPPDVQSFEMFITLKWRKAYDKLYALRNSRSAASGSRVQQSGSNTQLVKAGKKLTTFLKTFIENHDNDMRWKLAPEIGHLSRFLSIPPEMSSKKISLLYPDTKYTFLNALFLGLEDELMILNILTLSVLDLWLDNITISILFTYLLERSFVRLRRAWGNANVAKKTLVDDRFLI